jgi:carbon monoxide dehydrogenase subunit G
LVLGKGKDLSIMQPHLARAARRDGALSITGGCGLDITGSFRIPASRERVWEALNDVLILQACIPGCLELCKVSETELDAKMQSKIGPVKTTFKTHITLTEMEPPERYVLVGEGKGGAAGFARGSAAVTLSEAGDETVLEYTAEIKVGGKIAQIGSRLLDGTARKLSNDFFTKFVEAVSP